MARLIDADKYPCQTCNVSYCYQNCEKFLEWFNNTVDAAEVVHGRWKYYHKQNIAVCTNCSFERDLDANFGKAVSCPNCGAKMDGEKDNG